MTLATLRESIEAETRIPVASQHIYHNGKLASDDSKTMEGLEIKDGDMLAMHVRGPASTQAATQRANQPPPQQQQAASQRAPGANDPELVRLQILGDPNFRQQLQRQQPELAAALNDPARFAELLQNNQERELRERAERQREIARLNDDPFNVENQQRIEEMIRQERVMENLQNAMEHNPEGKAISTYMVN